MKNKIGVVELFSKTRKLSFIVIGILFVLIILVGTSYALWTVNLKQTGENHIVASCFNITFEEEENTTIQLQNAYPLRDKDGSLLKPYKFKIKNNCAAYVKYSVAIEVTNTSTLESQYLKTKINNEKPILLDSLKEGVVTLENTKKSYILDEWYLYENEEKEYELRLWLDENVTKETEGVQGATWSGIVTLTASYAETAPISPGMLRTTSSSDEYGMWKYRESITKIVIQNELKEIEGSIQTTDESSLQDGSVMSYVVPNEDGTTYTAYLQSNRKLILNPYSSYLFYKFTKVTEIEGMEYLDTSNVTNMMNMFSSMRGLASLDLSSFNTSNVTNMSNMFSGMISLTSLDLSSFDTSKVTDMSSMFSYMSSLTSLDLSSFDTSKVTDMSNMFNRMGSLTSLDLSTLDTSNVTNMSNMFNRMISLTSLDLSNFDTSKVTNMSSMFLVMSGLTSLDLSRFDTSNVTDMSFMFFGMSVTSLDLSSFDTSNVTNMESMFSGMGSLTSLDLSSLNTTKVTNMESMFNGMRSLTNLNLSGFDTSNVTNMESMFASMISLTNITYGENFIRKSGSNISSMFLYCPANKPTHESWNGAF